LSFYLTKKNRLNIPEKILIEISNSHGILVELDSIKDKKYIKHLKNKIIEYSDIIIEKPFKNSDYRYMARFVNHECEWTIEELEIAFEYLMSFVKDKKFLNIPINFVNAKQTPDNPYNINNIVVYLACEHLDIETKNDSDRELLLKKYLLERETIENKLIDKLVSKKYDIQKLNEIFDVIFNKKEKRIHKNIEYEIPHISLKNKANEQIKKYSNNDSFDNVYMEEKVPNTISNIHFDKKNVEEIIDVSGNIAEKLCNVMCKNNVNVKNRVKKSINVLHNNSQILSNLLNDVYNIQNTDIFSYISEYINIFKRNMNIMDMSENEVQTTKNVIIEVDEEEKLVDKNKTYYQDIDKAAKYIKMIHPSESEMKKYKPTTNGEIIAYAAIIYQIDISETEYPSKELNRLKFKQYNPYDKKLKQRIINKKYEIYSPYINIVFNPFLPQSCYTRELLHELAIKEGFEKHQLYENDIYESLQIAYMCETFFEGIYNNINNTDICGYKLTDYKEHELVSFGIRGQQMRTFTCEELYVTFNENNVFLNPADTKNSYFNKLSINKLKYILSKNHNDVNKKLIDIINYINNLTTKTGKEGKELLHIYNKSNNITKGTIQQALNSLLNLSMYMRGWDGISNYPIYNKIKNEELNMAINVTNEINNFQAICKTLHDIGKQILNLPLVRYKNGIFSKSNDFKTDGYTISDRLELIKSGNTTENTSSCVRLSSNWLASSAHKYMSILKLDPKFDIDELIFIG